MTNVGLLSLFLFLHVGGAIIAFGPSFVFPIVARFASREPMHANFAVRVNEAIEDRLVIPFALSMPVTGLLMIWVASFNLLDRAFWWLDIAIVVYVIAMYVAVVVQRPTVHHLVQLTSRAPAGGPPAGAPVPASAGPGAALAGPPPEVMETAKKIQRNGMILSVCLVVIVLLMVVKPQF